MVIRLEIYLAVAYMRKLFTYGRNKHVVQKCGDCHHNQQQSARLSPPLGLADNWFLWSVHSEIYSLQSMAILVAQRNTDNFSRSAEKKKKLEVIMPYLYRNANLKKKNYNSGSGGQARGE